MCRVRAKILVARKLGREQKRKRRGGGKASPSIFAQPESSLARDTKHFAHTGTFATQARNELVMLLPEIQCRLQLARSSMNFIHKIKLRALF